MQRIVSEVLSTEKQGVADTKTVKIGGVEFTLHYSLLDTKTKHAIGVRINWTNFEENEPLIGKAFVLDKNNEIDVSFRLNGLKCVLSAHINELYDEFIFVSLVTET